MREGKERQAVRLLAPGQQDNLQSKVSSKPARMVITHIWIGGQMKGDHHFRG